MDRLIASSIAFVFSIFLAFAQERPINDGELRHKLIAKSTKIANALNWPSLENPTVSDYRISDDLSVYTVTWRGGHIYFSHNLWLRTCSSLIVRSPGDFRNKPPIPKLSTADIKRAQIVAKRVCQDLGLGNVASFKELKADRARSGMYYPAIRITCLMQVKSDLPIHTSAPTATLELEPGSFRVNQLTSSLPVTIEPLTAKKDFQKAKALIADYVKKHYGRSLDVEKMAVTLCRAAWYEGEPNSAEAKRLFALRRRLIPIYRYKDVRFGEVWFDANTMKFLVVHENYPEPLTGKRISS